MGIRTGKEYRRALHDGRDVWFANERIEDVTTHPALRSSIDVVAGLYDAQHSADNADLLTYWSEDLKERVSITYLVPHTKQDLVRRRHMIRFLADYSCGMMGRTGDYVGTMVTAWAAQKSFFGDSFDIRVQEYFDYCRRADLFLTHALIDPQIDRARNRAERSNSDLCLRVVGETKQGIVVSGCKMIGTSAPIADEVLVWPLPVPQSEKEMDHAVAFAVPMSLPGLRTICRPSFSHPDAHSDFPLSSRYDEMDSVLIFEEAVVPWERVFIYKDVDRLKRISQTRMRELTAHQTNIRLTSKVEFIYGVLCLMAEAIGVSQAPPVQETLGEAATYLELLKAIVIASEETAERDPVTGCLYPSLPSLQVGRMWGPKLYPRLMEMMRRLGGGGLMQLPATMDELSGPLGSLIEKFYQGTNFSAAERIALFKLAWDLVGTEFGSRHQLYEMFYSGDPSRLLTAFQGEYNKGPAIARVRAVLRQQSSRFAHDLVKDEKHEIAL